MDCLRCEYQLVKHSLIAECAKCNYRNNWNNYYNSVAKRQGFKSDEHRQEFFKSLVFKTLKDN